MKRRGFFRTLFGTAVATVAAPLIPVVQPGSPLAAGYIYCPYIPILVSRELIGVHPMSGPTGTIFHMNLISSNTCQK